MKTILFLINGFGMEHKHSYSVYNKNLMPNLEYLKNKYLFSILKNDNTNYQDGYRNISLDVHEQYNYSLYDKESKSINNNKVIFKIKENKNKLHLFCFIDNSIKIVNHIKSFLINVNSNKNREVFLHLVLTNDNIEDYYYVLKTIDKLNKEVEGYAKFGVIMGMNNVSNYCKQNNIDSLINILTTEEGKRYNLFQEQVEISYSIKLPPYFVKPFIVNYGFKLNDNDIVMFFNYNSLDLTNFVKSINKEVDLYSLFPIVCHEYIPYILELSTSSNSLASNLKKLEKNALILAKKDEISIINYYCNGLQNIYNKDIKFIEFDNYLFKPKELNSIINNYDNDIIIINYDIKEASNIDELRIILHNIDIMLGNIYKNIDEHNRTLIVSSLYGLNKVLVNDKKELCTIIFEDVPLIIVDSNITTKKYMINKGEINDLIKIIYYNMDSNYNGCTILNKKSGIHKMIFQ